MARHLSMPSFVTAKRLGLVSLAVAGSLSVAGTAVAATAPPAASAAQRIAAVRAVAVKAMVAKAAEDKAAAAARARTQAHVQRQAAESPRGIATAMLGKFGWPGSQFSCLDPLWGHESRWSVTAANAGSGAYGIPQALPGSRMASAGPDWQTDAETQIRWGLEYIDSTYGSPCAAWSHEEADGWY